MGTSFNCLTSSFCASLIAIWPTDRSTASAHNAVFHSVSLFENHLFYIVHYLLWDFTQIYNEWIVRSNARNWDRLNRMREKRWKFSILISNLQEKGTEKNNNVYAFAWCIFLAKKYSFHSVDSEQHTWRNILMCFQFILGAFTIIQIFHGRMQMQSQFDLNFSFRGFSFEEKTNAEEPSKCDSLFEINVWWQAMAQNDGFGLMWKICHNVHA